MAVEPRISENSRVIGISTPVNWRLRRSVMHLVQRAGLPEDRRKPACLKTRPPSPANGAAHNLQRGGDGIRLKARRCLASQGLSPVSTARTCSVNSSAAISSNRLILEAAASSRGSRSREPAVTWADRRNAALSFRVVLPSITENRGVVTHHRPTSTSVERQE